ncbi:MAG: hypothetical protein AAF577_02760 [Pseudomonadota bacterium]
MSRRRMPLGIGRHLRVLPGDAPRWHEHGRMAERCIFIIQIYYLLTLARLYSVGHQYTSFSRHPDELMPLWPMAWLPLDASINDAFSGLVLAMQVIGVLGLFFWRHFIVRLLVCVAFLQHMTFANLGGAINHGLHEWFWLSFILLFLPAGLWRQRDDALSRHQRVGVMTVFAAAGGFILMFYSLSGYYKLRELVLTEAHGVYGALHWDSMAQIVGGRMFDTMSDPPLAEFLLNYPILGWPMFMLLYYVEVFAFIAIFRPVLLKPFAVVLILFHIGTFLFLDIAFDDHVVINGLFMLMSPLAPGGFRVMQTVLALPVIGDVLRVFVGRRWRETGRAAVPAE